MAKVTTRYISELLKYLNIDPLNGEYEYDQLTNSISIKGVSEADILAAEASLDIMALENASFNSNIYNKIEVLEAQQSPRLIREAMQGVAFSVSKLKKIDAEIAALRLQLK